MNDPAADERKVRFPRDLDSVAAAIERIAEDPIIVPLEPETSGRFDDEFASFRLKSGTYWRWVRPVFDGGRRSDANARIEFRPLSAQPTVRDSVAFQAAFAGLVTALPARDHPVMELPWNSTRENFYRAARDGIDADLAWIAADGVEAGTAGVYADVLEYAAEGLRMCDFSAAAIDRYLDPLRSRVDRWRTPATWKRAAVRARLQDGADLDTAIVGMQRAYLDRQGETLFNETFADWADPTGDTL